MAEVVAETTAETTRQTTAQTTADTTAEITTDPTPGTVAEQRVEVDEVGMTRFPEKPCLIHF